VSSRVFTSSSGAQAATTSSGTALEPVGISRPSKLELSGSDEGLLLNLILEQVCVFCGGGGFLAGHRERDLFKLQRQRLRARRQREATLCGL
jgi:hypothetical protein